MAKSSVFKKTGASGEVAFNMTPMIDCTFQLIIFFILSATVMSQALADLKLHRPWRSQARDEKEILLEADNRIIVNVVSAAGKKKDASAELAAQAQRYQILTEKIDIGNRDKLTRIIKDRVKRARQAGHKKFFVEIRADYRVNFGAVRPVMLAAAKAGVTNVEMKMNLTALLQRAGED